MVESSAFSHMRSFSRREFLAKTALTTAGLSASSIVSGAAAPTRQPVVIFSKIYQSLNLNFEDSASLTAEASLNGVDSPVRPGGEILPEKAADDLPRYAEVLRKHSLGLPLLTTAILSPSSPNAEEILRTAKKLGVQFYRAGFVDRHADQPVKAQIADVRAKFKDLAAMNKEIGIGAIVQNHSPSGHGYLGGDLTELIEILAGFDPSQIGAAFDIGHALKVHGDGWCSHFEKLKSHLRVAYIKDTSQKGSWVPFGQGEVGKIGYFKLLREIGYNAPLCMHIEFDWSNQGKDKTRSALLKAVKESAGVLKKWLQES
jgi:sugar phosphate isomerase/epimerase